MLIRADGIDCHDLSGCVSDALMRWLKTSFIWCLRAQLTIVFARSSHCCLRSSTQTQFHLKAVIWHVSWPKTHSRLLLSSITASSFDHMVPCQEIHLVTALVTPVLLNSCQLCLRTCRLMSAWTHLILMILIEWFITPHELPVVVCLIMVHDEYE